MFASIVFVVAVSLAAERVAARSVEACLPAKPSCGELSATECASVAACTTNEQSECVCRSDGFGEEYGWTASFACRVGGYDCMEFNEPGVGVIDAAKCPAGACELKTLTGAEADEWLDFMSFTNVAGCAASIGADGEPTVGLCLPASDSRDGFLEHLFQNDRSCSGVKGVVGVNDENSFLSKYSCGLSEVCCLPLRVPSAAAQDERWRNRAIDAEDPILFAVDSPTALESYYGSNYFVGEKVDLALTFEADQRGQTVAVEIRQLRSPYTVMQSFTVTLPTVGSSFRRQIELLGEYDGSQPYIVQVRKADSIESLRTTALSFRVTPPPCFGTVSIEFDDRKTSDFGGLCVASRDACEALGASQNGGEAQAVEFFAKKHCRTLDDYAGTEYGCCVPHRSSTSAQFRGSGNDQETSELPAGAASATLGVAAAMIAAAPLL